METRLINLHRVQTMPDWLCRCISQCRSSLLNDLNELLEETLSPMFQEVLSRKRFVDYIKERVCGGHVRADMQMTNRQVEIFDHIRPLSILLFKATFLGFIDCGSAPIPRIVRQTETEF